MSEKIVVFQIKVRCPEDLQDKEIERVLNRGINTQRTSPSSPIVNVNGQNCEVGFAHWFQSYRKD